MVSGLGDRSGGLFSSPRMDPRNNLLLDPVFKPLEDELREADRRLREEDESDSSGGIPSSLKVVPRLGEPVDRLAAEDSSGEAGAAAPLLVQGGSVELRVSGKNESLRIDPEDEVTVRQSENGITVSNRTTGKDLIIEGDTDVRVEGDGTATLAGSSDLSFAGGARLRVASGDDGMRITLPESLETVSVPGETSVQIEGEPDERLVLRSDRGRSLRFGSGESGSLRFNDDGSLVVRNEDTGREVTFDPESMIRAGGEAKARIGSPGGLTVGGGENLSIELTGETSPRLEKPDSVRSTSLLPSQKPPQPVRPLRLQILNHPESEQIRALGSRLVAEADGDNARPSEPRTRETNDRSAKGSDEGISPASFSEDPTPPQPASFKRDQTDENRSIPFGETDRPDTRRGENPGPNTSSSRTAGLEGGNQPTGSARRFGFGNLPSLGGTQTDSNRRGFDGSFDFSSFTPSTGNLLNRRV